MNTYVKYVVQKFEDSENKNHSPAMKKYMKGLFDYLGIKRPERDQIQKQIILELGYPKLDELETIVLELWQLPFREYQYFALDLLDKNKNKVPADFIKLYEKLIITKSWWDSVDIIAVKLVGTLVKKHPELIEKYIENWSLSDNIWLKRTAILYQLKYKEETNTILLEKYIDRSTRTKEFFLNKAIGWALRQYSAYNKNWVIEFVKKRTNILSNLSKKEALRKL